MTEKQPLLIRSEAVARIPTDALLQFAHAHGCEIVRTAKGDVMRPAMQPRDFAEEVA